MASDSTDETTAGDRTDNGAAVEYEVSSDERTWAILAHAMGLVGLVIPLGNIVGPVLVWALKKDDGRFVDENGKQAINFQIMWTIYLVIAALSVFIGIGLILVPLIGLVWLILMIIAIIRTSEDQVYDYPLTLELIS